MLTLKSRDGEHFEVEEVVALQSQTIKSLIEDVDCANNVIPLPNLTSKTLAKVLVYCKKHVEVSNLDEYVSQQDLKAWDADFVKVDRPTMFDLLKGADYLKIGSLLDLMSWTIVNMLKDKSPEEIREALNIKNDFTPEEEEAIRQAWGFEDLEVVFEISE